MVWAKPAALAAFANKLTERPIINTCSEPAPSLLECAPENCAAPLLLEDTAGVLKGLFVSEIDWFVGLIHFFE